MISVNSLYIFDSKQIGLKLLMSFLFPFLTNITIFASFHVLGMRHSVMHFVYSLASCFAMVSSPAFSVSMLTSSFPASFPLFLILIFSLSLCRCRPTVTELSVYCITPIFRVEEIFAIFANLDFARHFPPAKIISTANGISRNFPPAKRKL